MPKWRIIIPVVIVALVGVIAYMQMNGGESTPDVGPTTEQPADTATSADEPLDVTGEEDIDVQIDALVDDLLKEVDGEETEAGDGTAEINSEMAGETDLDILDVEYYAE